MLSCFTSAPDISGDAGGDKEKHLRHDSTHVSTEIGAPQSSMTVCVHTRPLIRHLRKRLCRHMLTLDAALRKKLRGKGGGTLRELRLGSAPVGPWDACIPLCCASPFPPQCAVSLPVTPSMCQLRAFDRLRRRLRVHPVVGEKHNTPAFLCGPRRTPLVPAPVLGECSLSCGGLESPHVGVRLP